MWFKHYRDYPIDKPLIKEQVEPGKGIIGCEMHDLNGWGVEHHQAKPKRKGVLATLIVYYLEANLNMDDPRQQHGNHTWDLVLHYYRCPKCHYIIEDRSKYEHQLGLLKKDLVCSRCQHVFMVTKKLKPTFGPFWGSNE